MKIGVAFICLSLLFASCNNDPFYESETDEHFALLKDDITSLSNVPVPVPVKFYWIQGRIDSLKYATTCLNTAVRFEKPYLIANGVRFHVYRWQSTQYIADSSGRKTSHIELSFYPE